MQLLDVSTCGLLQTISLWLVFKDFSHSGRRYFSIFLQHLFEKIQKMLSWLGVGVCFLAFFSFIKCSQKNYHWKWVNGEQRWQWRKWERQKSNSSEGLVPERPISANLRLQLCLIFVFTFLCIAQSNIMCYHYSISDWRLLSWKLEWHVLRLENLAWNNGSQISLFSFLCLHCPTTTWNWLISRFIENVNPGGTQQSFIWEGFSSRSNPLPF